MEFLKVKNENDCAELATVDAYNEAEAASGWMTCLEEVFGNIKSVKVLGQEVALAGFDIECETAVIAICKSGKKTARLSLTSIEWQKLTKAQQIWLKAWSRHAGVR